MNLFKTPPGPQQIQGIQISTAVNALPIPIIYGTPRWAGNVFWADGFVATANASAGGKGGKTISGFSYNAWFMMGLGEGPMGGMTYAGSLTGKPGAGATIYNVSPSTFQWTFPDPVSLITNVRMIATVAATASATFTVQKNGVTIGTLVFAPGTTQATVGSGFSSTTYTSGADFISIIAPSPQDATLSGLSWFFRGIATTPYVKYVDGTPFSFTFSYFAKDQTISNLSYFNGDYNQASESHVAVSYPNASLAYRGQAYVFGLNYRIDASATIPQIHFCGAGLLANTCPLNKSSLVLFTRNAPFVSSSVQIGYADADPALCIQDLLTDPLHGAGFPSAFLDPSLLSTANASNLAVGDSSLQTYCQAVGFGFSVALDSTESASSIVGRWCDLLSVAPVWTGLTLKFIPYWDKFASQTGTWGSDNPQNIPQKAFAPNVTSVADFDDTNIIQSPNPQEDPIIETRKDLAEKANTVRVSFRDRVNGFNTNVSEAKDENAIELYGVRVANLGEAKEFTLAGYAALAAQLRLQREQSVDRTFKFKTHWGYCWLDPMDVITVTDAIIGLNKQLCRIIKIEEDERFVLTIEAEILPLGAGAAIAYPKQPAIPPTFIPGSPPSEVFQPFIFEPPIQMLNAESQTSPTVVIGLTAGVSDTFDPNWAGAFVFLSIDNITYTLAGQINGRSRMGLLTANVTPGSTSILVDMGESAEPLETVSTAAAAANLSLCGITNATGTPYTTLELFSYTTATLTSTNHYTLTGLNRAQYGTPANSFSIGDLFLRIDPTTFQLTLPPQWVGKTLYAKFIGFNPLGQATDTLATVAAYQYIPNGQGTNPLNNPILQSLAAGNNQDWGQVNTPTVANTPIDLGQVNTTLVLDIDLHGVP